MNIKKFRMKKTTTLLGFLFLSANIFAQDVVKINVVYHFSYVRDLENKDVPYKNDMILSIGQSSSRYCTKKLFIDNDKKILEARKKEQERSMSMPSASIPTVTGGPMLTIGKAGPIITEEIMKYPKSNKISIETQLGLKSYHTETDLQQIEWTVLSETKKIGNYDCQKATGKFGGRTYEAWFTKEIPYEEGPWKLHGLPGLILEANDTANVISFVFKEILKNDDPDMITKSFFNSQFSIATNLEDLNKARKAFETDPEGVMSAQAPNARLYIRNIDNPNDKTPQKIKKINPMELE
jgi:GLPGLI family protein